MLALVSCSFTPQGREAKHLSKGKVFLASKDYKKAAIEFKVAAQNADKDAEPHYQLGLVYAAVGSRLAAPEFAKALKLNPAHLKAEFEYARLRTSSNDPAEIEQARQSLIRFSQSYLADGPGWAALAVAETKLGMRAPALQHLEKALTMQPEDADPVSTIVLLQLSKRDTAGARDTVDRAVALIPNSAEAALLKAKILLMAGDRAAGEAEIDRALRLKPNFRQALELQLRMQSGEENTVSAESTAKRLSEVSEKGMRAAYPSYLMREGKVDQSLTEFRRQIASHPDDLPLRNQFAAVLLSLGELKEAESTVAAILKIQKNDPDALLVLTSMRIDAGEYEAAEKLLDQVQAVRPNAGAAYYQRSRIAAGRGQTRREGDLLVEALSRNRGLLSARLELARLLLDAGNGKSAHDLLEGASILERQTPMCRFYYAGALINAAKWTEAREEVNKGLASARIPPLLNLDASLRLKENDLKGAQAALEEGLKGDPENIPSLNLLGEIYRRQNQGSMLIERVQTLSAQNPGAPKLKLFLGDLLLAKGDRAGARAAFVAVKNFDKRMVTADVSLARMDLQEQAPDQAKQRLLRSTAVRDSAPARDLLGGMEETAGAWEQAAKEYRRALDLAPADALAMNNLASVLAQRLGKVDEALGYAEKAKALLPNDPFIEDTVGCIYLKKNNVESALAHLQASAKTLDRASVRYHLASAYLKGGDRIKAESEYLTAVKLDPKSPERASLSAQFEKGT